MPKYWILEVVLSALIGIGVGTSVGTLGFMSGLSFITTMLISLFVTGTAIFILDAFFSIIREVSDARRD